jgi:hypothetical protein
MNQAENPMTLDEARRLHASATTPDKLDEIAAHAPGSAVVAIAALEALGVALAEVGKAYAEGGADTSRIAAADLTPISERLGLVADWRDVGDLGRLCIAQIDDIDSRRATAEASLMQAIADRDDARSERDEFARGCRNANERLQRVLKAGA